MKNKVIQFLLKHSAKIALVAAIITSGTASTWGLYQEIEPEELKKFK